MAILYDTVDIYFPKIKRRNIKRWIQSVANHYQKRVGDITYIFCSDNEILRINKIYLHHNYYTDIITFDYSQDEIISGDLFVSLETVKSNAEKFCTDYYEELHRVMIHGILHLCGLNDKTDEDKKQMKNKENEALRMYDIQI
jgi:rRNA maturation RNase YbeY